MTTTTAQVGVKRSCLAKGARDVAKAYVFVQNADDARLQALTQAARAASKIAPKQS